MVNLEAIEAADMNELYGKINDRFDRRAQILGSLGFVYQRACADLPLAVFVRRRYTKAQAVAASFVLYADDLFWEDQIKTFAAEA